MTTCQMSIELGAYVLHALEDDEAEQLREHLTGCDACREEERELSATASLLALLQPDDLDRLEVPAVSVERPRPRPVRRAVLMVALALLAAMSVQVVRAFDHPTAPTSTVSATDPATHVRAAVTLAAATDGTRLQLRLSGVYPRGWCSLVARSRDGRTDTAATWRADATGTADVAGTTAIPTSHLSELDVVTDAGRVLVRIPVHDT